jgi:hypothetical protein
MADTDGTATLAALLAYLRAGLSVIPIRPDGSKRPLAEALPRVWDADQGKYVSSWTPFQERLANEDEVRGWVRLVPGLGLAVLGGKVSGGLECLDFDQDADTLFPAWCDLVRAEAPGLLVRLTVTRTPKPGYHVRYRCPEATIPGNTKLARDPGREKGAQTLIETRGEGGYALAPGCPPACHDTGRTYDHHSGPKLSQVGAVTAAERDVLIRCARSFDRDAPAEKHGLRPGDDFDQRPPTWDALLTPHGWVCVRESDGVRYWRRPGKDTYAWSATTGRCTSGGVQLFKVFTSSAAPFEEEKSYGPFRVWAFLEHQGDFTRAAGELARQGYGDPRGRPAAAALAVAVNGPAPAAPPEAPVLPASCHYAALALEGAIAADAWPLPAATAAFHGLAGEVTGLIDPQTESDPVAVLGALLVFFGAAVGRGPYRPVGATRHRANLFAVVVGPTSRSRKGTALGWVRHLFALADPVWLDGGVKGGLSSGEGLIAAVQDGLPAHGGLLALEEEFAQVLRCADRDGNILSTVLRQAWDGLPLSTLTRKAPLHAAEPHVSLFGHCTRPELLDSLGRHDSSNGVANRVLWLCATRSKLRPDGGEAVDLSDQANALDRTIAAARAVEMVGRTAAARDLWHAEYPRLTADRPGLHGLVTSRAEAHVLRLSLLYALLDGCDQIDVCHLRAALALWDYSDRSCRWIFGQGTGDATADDILAALTAAPDGLTLTEISAVLGRHKPATAIRTALALLASTGKVRAGEPARCGRKAVPWRLVTANPANPANPSETQAFDGVV